MSPPAAGTSGQLKRETFRNGGPAISRPGRESGRQHQTKADRGSRGARAALIAFICGRRTKWVVVAFWLLVVVALGSLAGKLQGAEKNDASSYLPSSAESTQELNEQAAFQVQELQSRPGGVRTRGRGDRGRHRQGPGGRAVLRHAARRDPASRPANHLRRSQGDRDRRANSDLGYNSDISGFITTVQNAATKDAGGLSVYLGGPAASANDELKIFKGIDSTLLYAALAVVIVLLLLTYRSPGALAPADHLGRRGADRRPGCHLPAHPAREPDRQRQSGAS